MLASVPSEVSAACTFYVRAGSVTAPDTPDIGRTPETAFAKISDAARALRPDQTNPGEVVCVGPGVYVEGDITPRRSGIAQYPIVFRADPSGVATGDPAGPVRLTPPTGLPSEETPKAGFRLLGNRYIVIEGFAIDGFFDAGIQVRSAVDGSGNSSEITIRNNTVQRGNRFGIDINAEKAVTVEANEIIGNLGSGLSIQSCVNAPPLGTPDPPPRCRSGPSALIVPVVSNNRIGINGAEGIFFRDAQRGVVQNNVVFSNGSAGVTLRSAATFLVVNNLIYANGDEGLAIGSADLPSPNATVLNNTLYGNGQWGVEIGSGFAASPGGLVVNNIVQGNGGGALGIGVLNEIDPAIPARSTCGYTAGFNVTLDTYGPKTPRNVYDVRDDPQFAAAVAGPDGILGGQLMGDEIVDGSGDDTFRLRQGAAGKSPAVDTGYANVAAVGLGGSTAEDGSPDTGSLDAGFHYGASAAQRITVPLPFMPIYVRKTGDDRNDGKDPNDALETIAVGARRASAGVTVVVGPGRYPECQLRPPPDAGRAVFVGDASGQQTGERPGPVLIDVDPVCCAIDEVTSQCIPGETGFDIANSCFVVVDGFHVRGALDDGIQISSGSNGASVRNNVLFSNSKRGVQVINADDVSITNNLIYANGECGEECQGGGIQIGGRDAGPGSRRAVITHNTCYRNGVNGILIGAGPGASTHAMVRYNILQENGENGIQLGNNTTAPLHLEGFVERSGFNVNFGNRAPYGAMTPTLDSDRFDDPQLVDPAGADGILGGRTGDGFADDVFCLSQTAAGQAAQSPGVDYSDMTAQAAGLSNRSTRTDGVADVAMADPGYHSRALVSEMLGDCNDDGVVTVDELILAVNIALGLAPVSSCQILDWNDNGAVGIDELVQAVRNSLAPPL